MMKYECDARTTAWFKLQPKGHVTTLMKCERCGLMYKSSLGHERHNIDVVDETPKQKALSYEEVLHLKNEAIIISHIEKGTWEDRAQPVQSFMDMNHLPLESGVILDLDDLGKVWTACLKEEAHEVR